MPRFEPFAGIRYDTDQVEISAVTAPPYDVIDADERAALVAQSPFNVVHIDLPIDEGDGADPYERAAERFTGWQEEGVLHTDTPSFYRYRMSFVDEQGRQRHTLGVLGALELSSPGTGDILPHERTTPKAKSDRLQLLRATDANLSAVWGLSLAKGLSAIVETDEEPAESWLDDDGVAHELWIIDDPSTIARIADTVSREPVVIADGHHRYETCLAYRDERGGGDGGSGPRGLTLAYVVELVDDQLTVQAIHRLITGLPDDFDITSALDPFFEIVEAGPVGDDSTLAASLAPRLVDEGALGLIGADGQLRLLRPRPGVFDDVPDLDSSRLDLALAGSGVSDHELTFQHGMANVARAVRDGRAQYGVLLRPATVAQIEATAHARDRMPPKTTFFWPKPRTGTVFRDLG